MTAARKCQMIENKWMTKLLNMECAKHQYKGRIYAGSWKEKIIIDIISEQKRMEKN